MLYRLITHIKEEALDMLDKDLVLKLIQDKPWHHDFEIIPA
jgi:hypothetical protein